MSTKVKIFKEMYLKMSEYIDLAYPVYSGMPVYPGTPKVEVIPQENMEKGDNWNGTVVSTYTHAGTHCDAPFHYDKNGRTIDQLPISSFVYKKPVLVNTPYKENYKVTVDDLKSVGDDLYKAEIIFLNTGSYKFRDKDFGKYVNNFPSLSPEAALFIRKELPNVKAVAIDTISIEDLAAGPETNFAVHNGLLNETNFDERSIVIFEDYNPKPIIDKKLISAVAAPLRIKNRDGSPVNIVVEYEN